MTESRNSMPPIPANNSAKETEIPGFLLLFIHPQRKLAFSEQTHFSVDQFNLDGEEFTKIAQAQFFDWITDPQNQVLGVRLNITGKEDFWCDQEKVALRHHFDFAQLFARFWFGEEKGPGCKTFQDWEDYYFRSNTGTLLICLRTHLLNKPELVSLKSKVTTFS